VSVHPHHQTQLVEAGRDEEKHIVPFVFASPDEQSP
jgi:hypothetical protein